MSGQLQAILISQLGKEHATKVYASLLEAALHLQEALAPVAGGHDLGVEPDKDPGQLLEARLRNVARARALRDQLLEGGVGARQLADQLSISVQAVDQARKAEKLIALREGGSWRYPLWQFDFSAPDPFPNKLPDLAEAAGGLRLAVIRWLVEPDEVLGERPLDTLRSERWRTAVGRARQLFITAT